MTLGSTQPLTEMSIARSKRDGTRAETRFGLSAKRTSPFKSAGVSLQSTTGSRGVRISGQQLYRPCSDVQCKAAGYPLHSHLSSSLPLPCVTVCHQDPNALYQQYFLGGKSGGYVRLTTYHHPVPLSRNLRILTSWKPLGRSRPVMALIIIIIIIIIGSTVPGGPWPS